MTKEEVAEQAAARAKWLKSLLDEGGFTSAHEYRWVVDEYRKAVAKSLGTTEVRLDPMGFWFGGQSN